MFSSYKVLKKGPCPMFFKSVSRADYDLATVRFGRCFRARRTYFLRARRTRLARRTDFLRRTNRSRRRFREASTATQNNSGKEYQKCKCRQSFLHCAPPKVFLKHATKVRTAKAGKTPPLLIHSLDLESICQQCSAGNVISHLHFEIQLELLGEGHIDTEKAADIAPGVDLVRGAKRDYARTF